MFRRTLALALLVGALTAACGGSDADEANPSAQLTSTAAPHGGAPPEYSTPVLLVPGDYVPPSASVEARQKWMAAVDEAAKLPQFSGVVNGFRVYSVAEEASDPSVGQKECVSTSFQEVEVFQYGYLPPGTSAKTPQYVGVCADGTRAWVAQDFYFMYGSFSIGYELGERAVGTDAAKDRVEEGTVAGHPALIIRPLIEEGNGQSIVAFALDKGFIVVGALDLPLAETLKIAEGITCEAC